MFSNNEILCRFTKDSDLSNLKCDPDDVLVGLVLINKLVKNIRVKGYGISFFRYRRFSQYKMGNISSDSNLKVGKFSNDSHGLAGEIRKFGESEDFYFSIFLHFQKKLISRRKLLLNQYSLEQICKISKSEFWQTKQIVKAEIGSWFQMIEIQNARVRSRNVVTDEHYAYHSEGALEPTNWKSDIYQISENEVVVRTSSINSNAIQQIDEAVYIGSRKDSFYYHAMHWTLLKYFNLDPSLNGTPILIDSNLNLTVKNFILSRACRDFPDSQIVEIPNGFDYSISKLHLAMLGDTITNNRHFLQVDDSFRQILYKAEVFGSFHENESRRGFVLICKREHGVILKRPSLSNWDEIIKYLSTKNEVVVIDPALMSLEEQAFYFSKAKYVISEHGGALSNLVFVNKRCQIIELQLTLFEDMYGEMARERSLRYRCIKVEKSGYEYVLDFRDLLFETE